MLRTTMLFLAAALMTPVLTLSAQDQSAAYQPVLGEWEMTFETPRGEVTQQFVFTVEDGQLKGVVSGMRGGTTELKDVAFEDGQLTFVFERTMRERTMRQQFTATIDGDQMNGTITGGRGEREFTAKRKAT